MKLEYGRDGDFENHTIIGEPKTIKEAFAMVKNTLKKNKKKWYYFSSCLTPDYLRIDWGSWSEFFFVTDLPKDAKKQWDDYCNQDGD